MKSRLFLIAMAASAHPMGNFSVIHYTRLEVSAKGVEVAYVLDLGSGADGQPVARVVSNFELWGVAGPLQFE